MAILFDLDGTLIDSGPDFLTALNIMLAQDNLPAIEYDTMRPAISFGSQRMIEMAYGVSDNPVAAAALKDRFLKLYKELNLGKTVVFAGIMEILTKLKKTNKLGIVTNKGTQSTKATLHKLGLDKIFDAVVCGDTLATRKPNPDTILHAIQLLRADHAKTIFIGDSEVDATAGKAANVRTIIVKYGYIPNLAAVQQWSVDAIADSPNHVLEIIQKWQQS